MCSIERRPKPYPIGALPQSHEETPAQDVQSRNPPLARSLPPKSLELQPPTTQATTRGSELRGPRPLVLRQTSRPRQPWLSSTDTEPCPNNAPRISPARTRPSRAESRQISRESGPFDLEAFKWKAMKDWQTSHTKRRYDWYKFRKSKEFFQHCRDWSWRKKLMVYGSIAGLVLLLVIIITAAATSRSSGSSTNDDLSSVHVTNPEAFASGGATHQGVSDTSDGAQGADKYTYYSGTADKFPASSTWVAFEDMWNDNLSVVKRSCSSLGYGPDNSEMEISTIYSAIQDSAASTLVDHRFILATILQESHGCVQVGSTTSSGGVRNPGLMQSHNGTSYIPSRPTYSIYQMVRDGTQGTPYGAGLVQNLNRYGNVYEAARGYNSGSIAPSGDLSNANGATACYVSDIANRLTGWVNAPSTCVNY